ncbi:MAG: TolC family protein [Bacteroidetes bacterium]|nr:MAG: TolC family protein [Bacteroidota bacterium]
MNKSILICTSLLLATYSSKAQEFVSLDSAVSRAIRENHGIVIARNNTEIASNNARPGVSGLYPTLSVGGNLNYTNNNTDQEFVTGQTQNVDGAQTVQSGANVTLSYTLFDGMRNWNSYRQAQTLEDASMANRRLTIENTVVNVISQYYEVARQEQNLNVAKEAIAISLDRYERARLRKELGAGVTLDLLNAEVDLNRDSVTYRTTYTNLQNAKRNLTTLLALEPRTNFSVDTIVNFSILQPMEVFKNTAMDQNAALIAARRNQRANEFAVGAARSGYMPNLSVNGGYAYSRTDAEAGFLNYSQNLGWNAGLTLRWNLWDGQATQTRTDNAKLQVENSKRQTLNTEQQLMTDIENAYTTYVNALYVMRTEERNVATSQLNFDRTSESFSLGQVTNTTFREAQLNLIRSKAALLNARYTAKIAEIRLLQLSGNLIQDQP